jgi:hypothetical protein
VRGKIPDLRIELRIVPVGLQHPGLQIVDHDAPHRPAEKTQRIFQATDERLRVLPPDHFAVGFAGVTEHRPKQMRPAPLAVFLHPRALAEVHLQFVGRPALHPSKRDSGLGLESAHDAFHRLIAAREAVLGAQILMDAFGREPLEQPRLDGPPPRFAGTLAAGRAEGHLRGGF